MSMSMLGGPFNAYGDIMQGQMTSASLNNQATLADQNATEAEQQGQYNETRQSEIANSNASYGASGVTSNSGSVAAVIGESNANAQMDELNILHGADVKALNYKNQATMDRYGAASAMLGAYWGAAGALTGSAIQGLSSANQGGGSGENPNGKDIGGYDSAGGGESADMTEGAGISSAGEGDIGVAAIA